jgi:hypothetical protein
MPKVGLNLIIALTLVIALTLAVIASQFNPVIAAGAKGQTGNAASSSHVGSPGTGSKPNQGRVPGNSKWSPITLKRGLTKE